jgi:branched-chain amino acid transport system substrate-binding protein
MNRSGVALAIAASALLAAAGCSSSGHSSAQAPAAAAASGSSGSASSPLTSADVSLALKYVGGKAGKADPSKSPIVVGFVNQQGGIPSFPELGHAADAAVAFVNNQLGGIDGHPLKLDKCIIQAEEDGQKCAAQFLADKRIKITNFSLSVYGNATFYKTVGGRFPVLVSVAGVAADYNTPDVYELDGGGSGVLNKMARDAKSLGAKTISIISSNNPAGKFITGTVLIPQLKSLGVSAKAVYISDTSTTPDYVSALQASGASSSAAVMLVPVAPAGCISLYTAMKQLGISKPVVTDFWCSNDPVPSSTGGGPSGWRISSLADNPLLSSPEVTEFKDAMTAYGEKAWINVGSTPRTFGDILTIVKFATAIGADNLTPQAFGQQILAFHGPMFMVPGTMKCGQNKTYVGICGDETPGSVYVNGAWDATADTKLASAGG